MPAFTINGKTREIPGTLLGATLLDYLRDSLGLRGTKYGCGRGLCGACTVHLDGRAVRACQTEMGEVVGRPVVTIEGLATGPDTGPREADLHPVQQAWIAESVPQCGYCQAGQIMTAVAFLGENSKPTDADIRAAMAGNLCRCGTYDRIRKAVRRAAGSR